MSEALRRPGLPICIVLLALAIPFQAAVGTEVWNGTGPLGGNVTAIAIDPKDPQVLYSGFRMNTYLSGVGMILKSTDGSTSWTSASNGVSDPFVSAIAIDPQNSSILYALGNLLYKSRDGAASWQPLPLYNAGVYSQIVIRPDNPDVIYLAGAPGFPLTWTENGGRTWTSVTGFGTGILAIDPNHPATLYTTPNLKWVDRSDDGGATWGTITTQLTGMVMHSLVVDPANSSRLYAGGDDGLYVSNDSGAHWARLAGPVSQASVQCVSIHSGVLYAGTNGSGLYRSSDLGTSWTQINSGLAGLVVQALAAAFSNSGIVYAGTRAGVSKTSDGGSSWRDANNGIVRTQVISLAADSTSPGRAFAGTYDGLFRTDNRGVSWSRLDVGEPDPIVEAIAIDPTSAGTVYAGLSLPQLTGPARNLITKSTNGGGSWQEATSGLPADGRVTAIVIDSSAPSTIFVSTFGNGISKSSDGAQSWHDASQGLDDTIVDSLVIDPQNSSILYAGTSDHLVYKTTDGAARWSQLPGSPYRVFALVIDPSRQKILAGAWNGGISASSDGGVTWTKSDAGLPSFPAFGSTVYSLANVRSKPDTIFAAVAGVHLDNSDGGVFESADGGVTWNARNAGLSNFAINSVAADAQGLFAYAGTNGGAFSLDLNGNRSPITAIPTTQTRRRVVPPRE